MDYCGLTDYSAEIHYELLSDEELQALEPEMQGIETMMKVMMKQKPYPFNYKLFRVCFLLLSDCCSQGYQSFGLKQMIEGYPTVEVKKVEQVVIPVRDSSITAKIYEPIHEVTYFNFVDCLRHLTHFFHAFYSFTEVVGVLLMMFFPHMSIGHDYLRTHLAQKLC